MKKEIKQVYKQGVHYENVGGHIFAMPPYKDEHVLVRDLPFATALQADTSR